uniref:Uncharacterized protein n=1 Tax=Haptolina ericina TaxID=156174 RepID=A0A7S3AUT2_9EUKA
MPDPATVPEPMADAAGEPVAAEPAELEPAEEALAQAAAPIGAAEESGATSAMDVTPEATSATPTLVERLNDRIRERVDVWFGEELSMKATLEELNGYLGVDLRALGLKKHVKDQLAANALSAAGGPH